MKANSLIDTACTCLKTDSDNIQSKPMEAHDLEPLKIYRLEDVLDRKWTGKQMVEKLIEIDYQTIPNLNEEREGTSEQWKPIFMEHPRTWALLGDSPENILGYWHFVSPHDEVFARAKKGVLWDSELDLNCLNRLDGPGAYPFYFSVFAMLPEARNRLGVQLLVNTLFQELSRFAVEGIFFNEVCSNVFTEDGAKMNRWLGLQNIAKHIDYGDIYYNDVRGFIDSALFCKYPRLQEVYRLRFGL